MKSLQNVALGIIGLIAIKARTIYGSKNLDPIPTKLAEQFIPVSIDGFDGVDPYKDMLLKEGMKKYNVVPMPEFKGMNDSNQIMSNFFSMLYDVSDEDTPRTFELARNLIRLGFLNPEMYFSISSVVYNFSEVKYVDLKSKFEFAGYFIDTKE